MDTFSHQPPDDIGHESVHHLELYEVFPVNQFMDMISDGFLDNFHQLLIPCRVESCFDNVRETVRGPASLQNIANVRISLLYQPGDVVIVSDTVDFNVRE